jgi:hypothetical protein
MRERIKRSLARVIDWIRARLGLTIDADFDDPSPMEQVDAAPPEPAPEPFTTFVKLPASAFGRMPVSAIWSESTPVEVRVVWLTLLTLADSDGKGRETLSQIAAAAGLPRADAARAIEHLTMLKRVECPGDGSWRILNVQRYQATPELSAS